MEFRQRLLETLRAIQPVLEVPGVLVIGSEVPNLLEQGAASTLVVSQDVDIGVPVQAHAELKRKLPEIRGLRPAEEAPSVWVPSSPELIEVNFVGMDAALDDPADCRLLEDPELPLMVFGALCFLQPAEPIWVEGLAIPVPRPAGLLLEKLLTYRSGVKGDRDLLVALGLLLLCRQPDTAELVAGYRRLAAEHRHAVRSNLTILSLLSPHAEMPDPTAHRELVTRLLQRLEAVDRELIG